MANPQGKFSYPGIVNPSSGTYVCAHGVRPSRATITAPVAGDNPAPVGDIVISYGSQSIRLRDMRLAYSEFNPNGSGRYIRYVFEDRRWRWRFGETYVDDVMRLRDIIVYLLNNMGEYGYVLNGIPDDAYPDYSGDNSLIGDNPADTLQALCDKYSLRVVFDPVSNRTIIAPAGVGASLPNLGSLRESASVANTTVVPNSVRIVGDRVRFMSFVPLEAVGMDTDDKVKPIENLSYKPSAGWEQTTSFMGSVHEEHGKEAGQLAEETVFRWYRIRDNFSDDDLYKNQPLQFNADGVSLQDWSPTQRGHIYNSSLDLYRDATGKALGEKNLAGIKQSGWIIGERVENRGNKDQGAIFVTTDLSESYEEPWQYNPKTQIVKFQRPLFRIEDKEEVTKRAQAKMYLYLSYNVWVENPSFPSPPPKNIKRNNSSEPTSYTRAIFPATYSYLYQVGGPGGVDVVKDNDMQYWVGELPSQTPNSAAYLSNLKDDLLLERSIALAQSRLRKYNARPAQDVTYNSFVPISPDGAIQSVTWSFGGNGATTRATLNTEPDYVETKYNQRVILDNIKNKADRL